MIELLKEELNEVQIREVLRELGGKNASPEGVGFAIESYLKSLQHQAAVAQAFYFGRLEEGLQGFLVLPEDVRLQIDQLVWDVSRGQDIDLVDPASRAMLAAAIMYSVEMRMGISE